MGELGLSGAIRGKTRKTTIADPAAVRPADLVQRRFGPPAPNRLWVADLTYVSTWSGFAYVAFVVDAYARRILGWRVAATMATSMVLDAIEQAIWTRQQEGVIDLKDVVHHTDRGSQYMSIRFTERLAEAGIQPSVGAVGSSYDNALAETINGLYKTELIKPRKPWRTIEEVELATAEWVGAYCLSEATSASDSLNCKTKAVLSPDGEVLCRWGERGDGPGQFAGSPHSCWIDSRGDLYVGEVTPPNLFQKFIRR